MESLPALSGTPLLRVLDNPFPTVADAVASMAEIEAVVEPDSVRNDIWWESAAFIDIHWRILPISAT